MYYAFLNFTGLVKLTETNQIVLMVALSIGCTIVGFIADSMLRSNGFGPFGNSLMLIVGFAASAIAFNTYAPLYRLWTPINFIAAVGIGPLLLLVMMAFAKKAFARI